jgi:Sec-independent protein translocase protein TatA
MVLDVSFGNLVILFGVGLYMVGRQDLPRVSRLAGTQVGRFVGLLQGARARAERFAKQNELKQLQNELRMGLRELDAVKAEIAVSMSGAGIVGKGLGATVPAVNRGTLGTVQAATSTMMAPGQLPPLESIEKTASPPLQPPPMSPLSTLAPETHTMRAVAEEEWERQGIAFSSRAEQGAGNDVSASGSVQLANLLKETLIYDQYERVVQQQGAALQAKMDKAEQEAKKNAEEKAKK